MREFCVECRLRFGLVERSPEVDSTCTECLARMPRRVSLVRKCDRCQKAILRGERFGRAGLYGVACYCERCARRENDQREYEERTLVILEEAR